MRSGVAILDGANGFVCSNFIQHLLRGGTPVIALCRGDARVSARERVEAALRAGGWTGEGRESLTVIPCQLLEPDMGIKSTLLEDVLSRADSYWHLAASLKFKTGDRDELFETNVGGTQRALEAFARYARPEARFFHVSTAYSCGHAREAVLEEYHAPAELNAFRNAYEESKRAAELLFKEWLDAGRVRGCILRLGQVVGRADTGETNTTYGVFDFIKRLESFSRRYPGERVRIRGDERVRQNMVPIDHLSGWLAALSRSPKANHGSIFHLVDATPITLREITECICAHLPLHITWVSEDEVRYCPLTAKERIIAAGMAFTGKYACTDLVFSRENLERAIGPLSGPIMTKSIFDRMVQSALNSRGRS